MSRLSLIALPVTNSGLALSAYAQISLPVRDPRK
jgi:hypothetical protein